MKPCTSRSPRARRLPLLLALCAFLSACWVDGNEFCHEQPSEYAEDTYEQTCEGVTETWSTRGCNFDVDFHSQAECEQDCPSPATCTLVSTRLAGGTCSATICGR